MTNDNNRTKLFLIKLLGELVSFNLPEIESATVKALNSEYDGVSNAYMANFIVNDYLVVAAKRQDNKIGAIKRCRELIPGTGLKEAKDLIESIWGQIPYSY